jgi:tRNA G18 (ribose-2'-O)-methylase SpoU
VIVGNEEVGITPATLAACTARVVIPMAPGQDSLNVGVAAGVVLFELVRRRHASARQRGPAAP